MNLDWRATAPRRSWRQKHPQRTHCTAVNLRPIQHDERQCTFVIRALAHTPSVEFPNPSAIAAARASAIW